MNAYLDGSKAPTSIVSITTTAISDELRYLNATTTYNRRTNTYTLKVTGSSSKEEILEAPSFTKACEQISIAVFVIDKYSF